jgi:hypothetical protein
MGAGQIEYQRNLSFGINSNSKNNVFKISNDSKNFFRNSTGLENKNNGSNSLTNGQMGNLNDEPTG